MSEIYRAGSIDDYPTVDNSIEDTEFKPAGTGRTRQPWGEQRVQPYNSQWRQAWLEATELIRERRITDKEGLKDGKGS